MTSVTLASAVSLWHSIAGTPELSGVVAAWEQLVGADLPAIKPFLRPYRDLASSYPCPFLAGDGCPREVVVRSGEIRAVCRSRMQSCETLHLAKKDVVAYELDLVWLGAHLANALGLHGEPAKEEDISKTVRLGNCCPAAGIRRPVFLMASFLESRIERLVARAGGGFLLLVPTAEGLSSHFADFLRARDVTVVALAEATAISDAGELRLTDFGRQAMDGFATAALPALAAEPNDGMVFFPTPEGATWSDLAIRFIDGHTVSIQVRGQGGVFNYAQLGMASKKNAAPTVQWKLLADFAQDHGVMTWESRNATRKNRKRRELLGHALRRFFRINDDPIESTPDGKGWRTRFSIESSQ